MKRTLSKSPAAPDAPKAAGRSGPGRPVGPRRNDRSTVTLDERLRPWLLGAACTLVVARPLFPSEATTHRGDGMGMVVLWAMLAAIWALACLRHRRFPIRFGWLDGAVLALVGWHTASGVWAVYTASPRPAINVVWQWVGFGLLFVLFRQLVRTSRESRAVLTLLLALATAVGAFGLYQYFYELPQTRAAYQADPDGMLREAGLWFPKGSVERGQFEARLYSVEPLGTFALTNSLAGFLVPWLIVATGIALAGIAMAQQRRRPDTPRRWSVAGLATTAGAVVAVAVIGLCLVLTKSRSGWLAAGFGCAAVLWAAPRATVFSRRTLLIGLLGVVAAGAVFGVAVRGLDVEVLTEAGKSFGYRMQYWRSSIDIVAEYPWLGCGPGNFQEAYEAHKLPDASEEVADPHNFLLEVWATAGTPAALALIAAMAVYFHTLLRRHDCPGGPGCPGWPMLSIQPNSPDDVEPAARAQAAERYIAWGGLAGWGLGLIVAWWTFAMPSAAITMIGAPLAVLVWLLLRPWIAAGPLPPWLPWLPWLPGVAAAGLLVNLTFAGGIGFPGVSAAFWLLLAVTFPDQGQTWRQLPRTAGIALAVLLVAVAATCYTTAAAPTARCRPNLEFALATLRDPKASAADYAAAQRALTDAVAADPFAVEPWRYLADVALRRWVHTRLPNDWAAVRRAADQAIAKAPRSGGIRWEAGDRARMAYDKTRDPAFLREAIQRFQEAIERYPNNPQFEASLGLALGASGDWDGLNQHARRALWLSDVTPHLDKKLRKTEEEELRKSLLRNNSKPN